MNAQRKMMPPQEFLKELRLIKQDIKSGGLTLEDRQELLKQIEKMQLLVLELKDTLLKGENSALPAV